MDTYQEYFKKFEYFKAEQAKQKQRGLNNYNILTTVLKKSDEVRLHSRMIHSLLDPSGKHYQGILFLEKFIRKLNIKDFKLDLNNCSVYKEYQQIDLYITDKNKHIIIENKIYAGDQKNQIKRYIEVIKNENNELKANDILVIYLSLDRNNPTQHSLGDLTITQGIIKKGAVDIALYKSIHYKREITQWLKDCQYEVQNITNLNEVLKQYIDVVKMLNNEYRDKVMDFSEFLLEKYSNYHMAEEIQKDFLQARDSLINSFFKRVAVRLNNQLGADWEAKIDGDFSRRYNFPLQIYKKSWLNEHEANLIFGFEFDRNDYIDGYFGVVKYTEEVDIKNDIAQKFAKELKELSVKIKPNEWWVYRKSPVSDKNLSENFPRFALFTEHSEDIFVKGMMEIINIFEGDSKLMSKMNAYINDEYQ